jgi:ABC-type lipoprotein export system ATPase subunit
MSLIALKSDIKATPRILQIRGMFDLDDKHGTTTNIKHQDLTLDKQWNVGLIVGPSGSGKSTVAQQHFDLTGHTLNNIETTAVVDHFPEDMTTDEATALLSSVGFSSPPAWLRPLTQLSTGERFRAEVAIQLAYAQNGKPVAIDEFTSVIDRTVARIGSHAIAKHVRRQNKQFVAVACHYDIIDWLQPDWILDMTDGTFTWRSVQPRPQVNITVSKTTRQTWRAFAHHHYLSENLASAARCWVVHVEDSPAAFIAELHQPHAKVKNLRRISRIVIAPDFQGIGLSQHILNIMGGMYAAQRTRLSIVTSHPALIHALNRSDTWALVRKPSRNQIHMGKRQQRQGSTEATRRTATLEYMGQPNIEAHKALLA